MFAFIGVLAFVYVAGAFFNKLKDGPVAPVNWAWPVDVFNWVKGEFDGTNDKGV
jgi:hypothetical protein